jgi:hypothetical protein
VLIGGFRSTVQIYRSGCCVISPTTDGTFASVRPLNCSQGATRDYPIISKDSIHLRETLALAQILCCERRGILAVQVVRQV